MHHWNHETLKQFNLPLARKVLDQARHEQALDDYEFDMRGWVTREISQGRDERGRFTGSFCNTSACIAGTAFLLDPNTTVEFKRSAWGMDYATIRDESGRNIDVSHFSEFHCSEIVYGAKLLGMTLDDAAYLFCEQGIDDNDIALDTFESLIEAAEKIQYGELS